MVYGYCDHCKTDVMLNREDFNVCLAIILLIFTAGIGFIIYLVIYFSKPEDRCVRCGYKISTNRAPQYSQQRIQSQNYSQPVLSQPPQEKQSLENKPRFCTFCGERLNSEEKYCPNCGSRS